DALARESVDPVLLDISLRVQPEGLLDADLDPQALAVEPVLEALVEAVHRLVALEDVLERAAPGRVNGELLVRRHRPVDEAPPRLDPDLVVDLQERPFALPELVDRALERGLIPLVGM